jgi:hypothetical protein
VPERKEKLLGPSYSNFSLHRARWETFDTGQRRGKKKKPSPYYIFVA